MKIGICGEHGGDPQSVIFCHRAGLDYVSCSPYRVPIARLAAAQAALPAQAETLGRGAASPAVLHCQRGNGSLLTRRQVAARCSLRVGDQPASRPQSPGGALP
jgi:putative hemolysin